MDALDKRSIHIYYCIEYLSGSGVLRFYMASDKKLEIENFGKKIKMTQN